MPAFTTVLEKVAEFYRTREDDLREHGEKLVGVLGQLQPPPDTGAKALSRAPLGTARATLEREFDCQFGGFGEAPKFPHPTNLEFLLRAWRESAASDEPDLQSLYMATLTLTRMAEGGIYDQLGGGFSRYSVDPYWMIPHFEKMLYDNGQLLAVVAQAASATGEPLFRRDRRGNGGLDDPRPARSPRRLLFDARRRLRRPRRQVLRLDARRSARPARARRVRGLRATLRARPRAELRRRSGICTSSVGRQISRASCRSTPTSRWTSSTRRARDCCRCATGASGRVATRRS